MSRNYLPIVNPEVGYSLAESLNGVEDEEYIEKELARIEEENPAISIWIRDYASQTEDPMGSMFCSLFVYKMLESQAESDRMSEEIKW